MLSHKVSRRQILLNGLGCSLVIPATSFLPAQQGIRKGRPVNSPVDPHRSTLYEQQDLLREYDPDKPASYLFSKDFAIYRSFVAGGKNPPQDYLQAMKQAIHDASITQALLAFTEGKKCISIMGGHALRRDEKTFAYIAKLSRDLVRCGFMVASGGGPGAMEATHLGAFFATANEKELQGAINTLASAPTLPQGLSSIVSRNGTINEKLAAAANKWYSPAVRIARSIKSPVESLGVPTWHYGHEPFTPFATKIAKYFSNSIRTEMLLGIAKHGVICAPGKAGTIQEIFQAATQNYYKTNNWFSPIVLFGTEYWTKTYPVFPLLQKLFGKEQVGKYVQVMDSFSEISAFLRTFIPERS